MTVLEDQQADYVQVRRQLGFKLKLDGYPLADFVAFLETAGAERIIRCDDYCLVWFVVARATCLGHNPLEPRRSAMGEKTDKIEGRAKQAVGAVTGDEETKREGERQEDKGKLKGKVDSAIDKAQGAVEDVKDKAEGAVEDVKDKLDRK